MNRTEIKGSIIVEAIVVLGLIASFTPILYKHVSDRLEDIENINEANTMLLLKNATSEYIAANKDRLSVGSVVLNPSDLGLSVSGYQIGIKKDSDGTINALITGIAATDLQAGKIASLLGISAGIYSAQDTAKAWGINGIWAENISSYGFTSLPTGIPVVTTTYDKEEAIGINEEELKELIENTTYDKFSVNKICLNGNCITEWITEEKLKEIIESTTYDKFSVNEICLNENCITEWIEFSPEVECLKNLHCENREDDKTICDITTNKCFAMPPECNNLIGKNVISVTSSTESFSSFWSGTECRSPIKDLTSYTIKCPGNYKIELRGEAGKCLNSYTDGRAAAGGILKAEKLFSQNTVLSIKSVTGGYVYSYTGGAGISFWENGNMLLVAGGGSGKISGGGGKVGGTITSCDTSYRREGYGFNGNKGTFNIYPSVNTESSQGGGGTNAPNGEWSYGGSGTELQECLENGFTNCTLIPVGGQTSYIPNSYSAASYGNRGVASATVTYLGL